MSTMQTDVAEFDVVALLNSVGGWPSGTEGTIIHEWRASMLVEICNERGEALDELDVPKDQLRLVWKCPPDDHAIGEGSDRAA
jgi:hypothetical protein